MWGSHGGSWTSRAARARLGCGGGAGRAHGVGYVWLPTLDFAQRLAELLLERQPAPLLPEAPARTPPEGPSHHLALQLANTKAQLRRLRQEL